MKDNLFLSLNEPWPEITEKNPGAATAVRPGPRHPSRIFPTPSLSWRGGTTGAGGLQRASSGPGVPVKLLTGAVTKPPRHHPSLLGRCCFGRKSQVRAAQAGPGGGSSQPSAPDFPGTEAPGSPRAPPASPEKETGPRGRLLTAHEVPAWSCQAP